MTIEQVCDVYKNEARNAVFLAMFGIDRDHCTVYVYPLKSRPGFLWAVWQDRPKPEKFSIVAGDVIENDLQQTINIAMNALLEHEAKLLS